MNISLGVFKNCTRLNERYFQHDIGSRYRHESVDELTMTSTNVTDHTHRPHRQTDRQTDRQMYVCKQVTYEYDEVKATDSRHMLRRLQCTSEQSLQQSIQLAYLTARPVYTQ